MVERQSLTTKLSSRGLVAGLVLSAAFTAFAQAPVSTMTPGSAVAPFRTGPKGTHTDAADGRHFRAQSFQTLTLDAELLLPSDIPSPVIKRLVVHFHTSKNGPTLRSIAIGTESNFTWHIATSLSGDYGNREQAVGQANTFVFGPPAPHSAIPSAGSPLHVGRGVLIRFEVSYPGGFEGCADPGEFVIRNIVAEFEPKPVTLPTSTPANRPGPIVVTPANAPSSPLPAGSSAAIYTITPSNELFWYGHTGREDGTFRWANRQGQQIGNGWAFKEVFSAGDGVIYAVTAGGDLLWYRHDGRLDGTRRWSSMEGKRVGVGWNFKHVFSGGGGVLYAVTDNDDLLWYRHIGFRDGSDQWFAREGMKIGNGWAFPRIFSGGDGVIYAVTYDNRLLWYRHEGHLDGSNRWTFSDAKVVGNGWAVKQIFYAGEGVIYTVNQDNALMWYRHEGYRDGSRRWTANTGRQVGVGWDFKQVFSGASLPQ